MNITPTVKQLLIINAIFYVCSNFLGNVDANYKMFSMYYYENPNFRFWQPFTHMFMHAQLPNFAHILFNMFGLYSFGSALEQIWGSKKFLFFYISCGLGAALVHTLVSVYQMNGAIDVLVQNGFSTADVYSILGQGKFNVQWQEILTKSDFEHLTNGYIGTVVGASGAIYGIIVAFAFMFPNAELALLFVPVPIKAKYFVPGLVIFDLFSGVTGFSIFGGGNIAHFAHVGGAFFGFVMMWIWKKNQYNKNRWN